MLRVDPDLSAPPTARQRPHDKRVLRLNGFHDMSVIAESGCRLDNRVTYARQK